MMTDKKTVVEEVVEDMMEDPDAAEKGNTTPPQTVENEPAERPRQ